MNTHLGAAARAVELTLETAKKLRAALDRAIAAAEEAEVRGQMSSAASCRRVKPSSPDCRTLPVVAVRPASTV
jgi:hypothetical protein